MPEETTAERVERIRAERDAARAQALAALRSRLVRMGDEGLVTLALILTVLPTEERVGDSYQTTNPDAERLRAEVYAEAERRGLLDALLNEVEV